MGYKVYHPARVAWLSSVGGDYPTLALAIADSANWDWLGVSPETHLFDQQTLPAAKCIQGESRDNCVLQTTHSNVADDPALSMGNQATLRNLWVRGAAAGATRISLIDFSGAVAGQYINLDGVRTDNGGGAQPYRILAPVMGQNCWMQLYMNNPVAGALGVLTTPSQWKNTRFEQLANTGIGFFWYLTALAPALTVLSSTFNIIAGTAYIIGGNSSVPIKIAGCIVPSGATQFLRAGLCDVSAAGINCGGLSHGVFASTIRVRGGVNYAPAAYDSFTYATEVFVEVDPGLPNSSAAMITAAGNTNGFESRAFTNSTAAAFQLMLQRIAQAAHPWLLIGDYGVAAAGVADRLPVTLARSTTAPGTDTFSWGGTSYPIQEQRGYALLFQDPSVAPDIYHVVAASRPVYSSFFGDLETNGACQHGSATPDGSVTLFGDGLFGNITTVSAAPAWATSTSGGYLALPTAAVVNDRSYWCSAAPTGPFSGAANWDIVLPLQALTTTSADRLAIGLFDKSLGVITDAIDNDDPANAHVLLQKIPGSATALRFVVRPSAGGAQVATALTTTLTTDLRFAIISKRGTVFTCALYSSAGAFIEMVSRTEAAFSATASLAVVSGYRDIGGAGAHGLNAYRSYGRQMPAAMPL